MTVWLDGPMGTELYARGIGDVFAANVTHPAAVREVHQAYVAAGAEIVLTNTFTAAAAFDADESHAATCVAAALEHVRGMKAYFSLGPLPLSLACVDAVRLAHQTGAIEGAWLETFAADDPLVDAWLSALTGVPIVLTTLTHRPVTATLRAAGLNCGLSPLAPPTERPTQPIPFVWKPATRLGARHLSPQEIARASKHLAVDWIGLCCGGTAAQLFALRKAIGE